MTSVSGPACLGGSSGSVITAVSVAIAEPLSYGGLPSTDAYSSPPSDQRSAAGPGLWPRARSGEMYEGAPTSMPVEVTEGSPSTCAMPKSVRTTRPSSAISTFDGFTSRCRMPSRWAERSTSRTASPTSAARRGDSRPSSRTASARDLPSTSSMTIQGRSSSSTTSKTVTAPLLRIRAIALASRSVRVMSRRFSSSSMLEGKRSSFTATVRPSISSSARQTVPMPPRPRTAPSRYLPASRRPSGLPSALFSAS